MTFESFVQELSQLPVGVQYPYLPSFTSSTQNFYTLLSVSSDAIRVKRDDSEISVSLQQIKIVLENLRDNVPLDIEKLLGSSGNARSIIESLICLTKSVFYTRLNKRKHIVLMSGRQHAFGKLAPVNETEMQEIIQQNANLSREDKEKRFKDYLTNVARSKRTKKPFSPSAVSSYLIFIKKEKLFDYNLSAWSHIQNTYDVESVDSVLDIINQLQSSAEFKLRNKNDNQGWRLGSINQYRDFLLYQKNETPSDVDEPDEYSGDDDMKTLVNQKIFFGAPGTGKSHEIKKQTAGQSVVRTTFHPDSDYSTFVGAYKPTTKEIPVTTVIGTKAVLVEDSQGNPVIESKIVYEFVEQAFLKAYVNAWTLLAENKPQFLIVEEINRGNCAQIFGDLFQLLDRNDFGFSDYPITADKDLQKHLKKAFENLNISGTDIEGEYEESNDSIAAKVKSGEVLLLPKNLYIWATMNTSDQSLFPIDSAFKRRWDWKYIPIDTKKENWSIKVNGSAYSWSDFLEKINEKIGSTTSSEDKKLGFYFCKACKNEISADRFVSKVLFYIYNDVFKDYGYEDPMFKNEGKVMPFQSFYNTDGSVNETVVDILLKNLGVTKKDSAIDGDEGAFDDENTLSPTKRMKFIRLWDQELKIEDYKTNFGMYSAALDVIAQKCGIDNVIDVVKKHGLHRYNKPLLSKIDPRDAAYVYQNAGYYILKTGVNVVACNSLFKNLQRDLNFEMEIIRDE